MPTDTALQEEFLQELERSAPEETHQTYTCIVESLEQYQIENNIDIVENSPDQIATFIRSEWDDLAEATIQGKLCSLSNILGYLWGEDPAVCKRKVMLSLDEQVSDECDRYIPTHSLTDSQYTLVSALRDWLRSHKYGSRLHAVVELILDGHAHPTAVRELDRDHVDYDRGTVTIQLPKKYALSHYGIRETLRVKLSPHTQEVLDTYCQHHRVDPTPFEDNALFTTSFGRVSRSTLSRDCRTVSETMLDSISHDELVDRHSAPEIGIIYDDVTLEQVWRYSLDNIENTDV